MATHTLWGFLRHGQSEANESGWFAGRLDSPLTSMGEDQARNAREAVAGKGFERAFASDLRRAHRTAEILLAESEIPLVTTAALRERACGEWEGRSIDDIVASGDVALFDGFNSRPPGGETLGEVGYRALSFLASVDAPVPTLVVAHGALMRSVLGLLDGSPHNEIGQYKPGNCELIVRELEVGRFADVLSLFETSPG